MPLIFFFCLIAPVRTLSTMLNHSGYSAGHPDLFQILEQKDFQFVPVQYDTVFGSVIGGFHWVDVCCLCTQFLRVFIMKECWILSNAFSTSVEMILWFLSFILFLWCITLIDSHMLNHPWIWGIQGCDPLGHNEDLFNVLLNSVFKKWGLSKWGVPLPSRPTAWEVRSASARLPPRLGSEASLCPGCCPVWEVRSASARSLCNPPSVKWQPYMWSSCLPQVSIFNSKASFLIKSFKLEN